jgi:hypothetical protein
MPFFLAFEAANEHAYVAYMEVLEDWMSKAGKEHTWLWTGTAPRTMFSDEVRQFSQIMKDIYFSKLCRKVNCLFFGGNNKETWIESFTGFELRCPMCGCERRTSQTPHDASDVQATRVLTMRNPLTGEWMHIPTALSGSENWRLINNLIEVTARDMQNEGDWEQWDQDIHGEVEHWLARESTCEAWLKFPYCRTNHLSYVDPSAWDDTKQLENKYIMGLKLTDIEGARQPFEDFRKLFREFHDFAFRWDVKMIKIWVAMPNESLGVELDLCSNYTVGEVKNEIQKLLGIRTDEQRISFAAQEDLENDLELSYYRVHDGATLRWTRRVALR